MGSWTHVKFHFFKELKKKKEEKKKKREKKERFVLGNFVGDDRTPSLICAFLQHQ
jgi:hypothetical protein